MIELRWLVHGSCSHANPQSRISIASPPPPPPPAHLSPHPTFPPPPSPPPPSPLACIPTSNNFHILPLQFPKD